MIPILLDEERDSLKSHDLFSNGLRMWTLKDFVEFSKGNTRFPEKNIEGLRVLKKEEKTSSGIYVEWATIRNGNLIQNEQYELAKQDDGWFGWNSNRLKSNHALCSIHLEEWYFSLMACSFDIEPLREADCYQARNLNFYDPITFDRNTEILLWWFIQN